MACQTRNLRILSIIGDRDVSKMGRMARTRPRLGTAFNPFCPAGIRKGEPDTIDRRRIFRSACGLNLESEELGVSRERGRVEDLEARFLRRRILDHLTPVTSTLTPQPKTRTDVSRIQIKNIANIDE